ncbi:MAG: hypothetical protein FJZ98_08360 [Chloroflexi bacterium]|nr:hypothetical protein [Chloroflexota bacterium]
MMLEIAPDRAFGVLSPVFRGCEGKIATNTFSENHCTFFLMIFVSYTTVDFSRWNAGSAIMTVSVRALLVIWPSKMTGS